VYLSGDDHYVNVRMFSGRVVGMSFPMDGNKHNDSWAQRTYPVMIAGMERTVTINTYDDGSLISIEVDLPESVTFLSADAG
jgi:hypothetical protein